MYSKKGLYKYNTQRALVQMAELMDNINSGDEVYDGTPGHSSEVHTYYQLGFLFYSI